jgi:hypothetical protein
MTIVVHGFSSGLTHTDEQRRPPGLSTRANRRRLGDVGEEHVPETHGDAIECGVVERQVIGAARLRLDVGDPLLAGSSRGDVQHLRDEVGQHDASLRRQSRDAQTRLTRACGNVEMLMIFIDVETVDDRCADWAQLIHDDRVPLLPARREPGHVAR